MPPGVQESAMLQSARTPCFASWAQERACLPAAQSRPGALNPTVQACGVDGRDVRAAQLDVYLHDHTPLAADLAITAADLLTSLVPLPDRSPQQVKVQKATFLLRLDSGYGRENVR
ncbi:hypothetical protein GOP47_0029446 [Adiantum capillus-veneris]|nr:hypothetical protein GOP47_0029446 [Adiantum capillus-veneris]